MSITTADLEYRLTNPSASAGNQLAQDFPDHSLGGYLSTTVWDGGVLHDLFPALTGTENSQSVNQYLCLMIINKHATLTLTSPVLWIVSQVAGGATVAVGIDPTTSRPIATNQSQAITVANINTAPQGVTFSAPTSKGSGLSLGNLAPGYTKAIWIRRTAANSAAVAADGFSFRIEGDTL